jgi:hypothetical protein
MQCAVTCGYCITDNWTVRRRHSNHRANQLKTWRMRTAGPSRPYSHNCRLVFERLSRDRVKDLDNIVLIGLGHLMEQWENECGIGYEIRFWQSSFPLL